MGVSVWLLFFCVGVVLLETVISQASVPIISGRQRTAITVPEVLGDPPLNPCETVQGRNRFTCGSCTSIAVCNYKKQNVGSYDCSSIDPLKPYCKDGICQAQQEVDCKIASDLCPDVNRFYPVPHNCSEAVFCDQHYQGILFAAPTSSYIFNFQTESWVYSKSPDDCSTINCAIATNLNKYFEYKPYPKLYIYCGTSGPLTFQCPNNEVFNESTKVCEFGCTVEGKFAIPGVTDKYYSCLAGPNGTIQKFVEACPTGMQFVTDKCVISG